MSMSDCAPARIFISYSRKDGTATAIQLRHDLEAAGHSIWHDLVALEGGHDWWSQIEEALKSKTLQHFLLVLTPGALGSSIVRREIRYARQEGKTVLPIKGPGLDFSAVPRWIGHVYDLDIEDQRFALLRVLEGPSTQKRVPMMAEEPPVDFVARPIEYNALKSRLLNAKGDAVAITAALRGAGGYGKTTLAKALAHDADIIDAYFDGILWVELGEKPPNLTGIISDLILTLTGERLTFEGVNTAAAKFGEALGDLRFLLVIDDAWREQDLRPFLQSGRNTTRLITTRRDDILPAHAERQSVDAMRSDEAFLLLAWGLPEEEAKAQAAGLNALAGKLGEWAQLLKLVNGFLRDGVAKKQPLKQAIDGVNLRLAEKGFTAFDAANPEDRTKAVAKTLGVSLDLLAEENPDAPARFAELAVFPEDVDVPIAIVARFWAKTGSLDEIDTENLLRRLHSLSLLLSLDLDQRSFRFHDTVRNFLQDQAGRTALAAQHMMLLRAMRGAETSRTDGESRRYYYLYRPAHLSAAGQRAELSALLEDPAWLKAKFDELGNPQALISDYELFGHTEVHNLIDRALRLTKGICLRDKLQLLPQLHGRLTWKSATADFGRKARKIAARPALFTFRPSLTQPGAELARIDVPGVFVSALVVLRDGRIAFSDLYSRTIGLWKPESDAPITWLRGHEGSLTSLAVLPDGRLASGSEDNTIRLWDPKTSAEVAHFKGHTHKVMALAILRDGRLASGSKDNTVRLWNVTTGAETAKLDHRSIVEALAVLADGRLASGGLFDTIRLWDPISGVELAEFKGSNHSFFSIHALAVLRDGRLASGSGDNTIRLWDPSTGIETATLGSPAKTLDFTIPIERTGKSGGHGASVRALAALPDGRLASASDDTLILIWDPSAGTELARLEGHEGWVTALAVMPDGRLVSGGHDGTIRLWDTSWGANDAQISRHSGPVNGLAVLPDGRVVSSSRADRTIKFWDPTCGTEVARLEQTGGPHIHKSFLALAALSDGRLAISRVKHVLLHDSESGAVTVQIDIDFGIPLVVLPNGTLVSGSLDQTIRAWDHNTGAEVLRIECHDTVRSLAVLKDGRLASGFSDGTIRIWDPKSGVEIAKLSQDGEVTALTQLPDGGLASGSHQGPIYLWDTRTCAKVGRLEGHVAEVTALAVPVDGRLISSSSDRAVVLWELKAGTEITRLEVDAAALTLSVLSERRLVVGDAVGSLHWIEILDRDPERPARAFTLSSLAALFRRIKSRS